MLKPCARGVCVGVLSLYMVGYFYSLYVVINKLVGNISFLFSVFLSAIPLLHHAR